MTTLLGDLENKAKSSGSDVLDPMVVQTCKKYISNNNDTIKVLDSDSEAAEVLLRENTILTEFLPKQLTESEIRSIIIELKATNLGQVMKHLNANYSGKVDNKLAKEIALEVI